MGDDGRLFIFTGVHGRIKQVEHTVAAVQSIVRGPAMHLIGDDFSSRAESERLLELNGFGEAADGAPIERSVFHLRELGCKRSPNYSTSLLYAWELARAEGAEALWVVEADVIPHAGALEAFRQAQNEGIPTVGAVGPLYVERGSTCIASFGGVDDWPEDGADFEGLRVGSDIGERDAEPHFGVLPWTHLACTWFPRQVLEADIAPDVDFPFYYVDHDLCEQISAAGMSIIVTDRAVAEHTPGGSSHLRWRSEKKRDQVREDAYERLCEKWPHIRD